MENINSSVLSLFIDQLSHPYMTTGKTIPLTTRTFVNKVLSLLFNTVFKFVIAFLPRKKCLLISWLQSPRKKSLVPGYYKDGSVSTLFGITAFFMVQLSHPYMTTGKTIALTRWTFVSEVMPLLFNMLSRFLIAFLLRSKYLFTL